LEINSTYFLQLMAVTRVWSDGTVMFTVCGGNCPSAMEGLWNDTGTNFNWWRSYGADRLLWAAEQMMYDLHCLALLKLNHRLCFEKCPSRHPKWQTKATCGCVASGQSPWARTWAAASTERPPCLWHTALLRRRMQLAALYKWTLPLALYVARKQQTRCHFTPFPFPKSTVALIYHGLLATESCMLAEKV